MVSRSTSAFLVVQATRCAQKLGRSWCERAATESCQARPRGRSRTGAHMRAIVAVAREGGHDVGCTRSCGRADCRRVGARRAAARQRPWTPGTRSGNTCSKAIGNGHVYSMTASASRDQATLAARARLRSLQCHSVSFGVAGAVTDTTTGQTIGKRRYTPVTIRREVDKASPLLWGIAAENKVLGTVEIFIQPPAGQSGDSRRVRPPGHDYRGGQLVRWRRRKRCAV